MKRNFKNMFLKHSDVKGQGQNQSSRSCILLACEGFALEGRKGDKGGWLTMDIG